MYFIDLNMKQNKDGLFDLAFSNGGLDIDSTLETSIATSLFTDNYSSKMSFEQRRGCFGIYYGNTAWTKLDFSRNNDEDVTSFLNAEYNKTLNKDFVEDNVWNFSNIEVRYILGNLYINITGNNNISENNKFNYNYKISGEKNG